MLLIFLLGVYIGAIGLAGGLLLLAIDRFEPNRPLARVFKVLIMAAAAAAVINQLLHFAA